MVAAQKFWFKSPGGGRPRPVGLLARHHGPHDTGRLDGQSHRRELARLATQQVEQPRRGGWPTRLGVLDDGGCLQHQQLPQPLVASPADAAQALSAGSRAFARRGPGYAGAQIGSCR